MSQAECEATDQSSARAAPPRVETRIDGPHALARASEPDGAACRVGAEGGLAQEAEARTVEPVKGPCAAEQLRRQADQLAAHLRARQREIDHREAQVNAKIAQLEIAARQSRLSHGERQQEMDERAARMAAQEQEFTGRLERLAAAEAAAQRRQAAIEQELACREESIARREESLRHQEQALENLNRETRGQIEMERTDREAVLRQREEELEATAARQKENERKSQEMLASIEARSRQVEEAEVRSRRLVLEQQQATAELERQRASLGKQFEEIDRTRTAMDRLRDELGRIHRETLEDRLATQELWTLLSGVAEPEQLLRLLAPLRARLTEHYRTAHEELADERCELESLRRGLAEEYDKLVRFKREVDQWADERLAASAR